MIYSVRSTNVIELKAEPDYDDKVDVARQQESFNTIFEKQLVQYVKAAAKF